MGPEGLERHHARTGPLHRLDARIKLVAALGFILVVLATPFGAWTALGVLGLLLAFVIGMAGIPPLELARRWLAFFVLVGFLTLMVAPANPARAEYGLWVVASTILFKNTLALLTMLVLAGTTPFPNAAGGGSQAGHAARARRNAPVYGPIPLCLDQ